MQGLEELRSSHKLLGPLLCPSALYVTGVTAMAVS